MPIRETNSKEQNCSFNFTNSNISKYLKSADILSEIKLLNVNTTWWLCILNWNWTEGGDIRRGWVDPSRPGLSLATVSDESSLFPLLGGKHVGAVVDAQDGHLLSIMKILQELKNRKGGNNIRANRSDTKHCTHTHSNGASISWPHSNVLSFEGKNTHFGRDEEILGCRLFARCVDHNVKNSSLIYRIHSLHRDENHELSTFKM